jgi:hypothetical protein
MSQEAMTDTNQLRDLAAAMKKLLPPELLSEVLDHLDPTTAFLDALRDLDAGRRPRQSFLHCRQCDTLLLADGDGGWSCPQRHAHATHEVGAHLNHEDVVRRVLANLRHMYKNLIENRVKDTASFANGLVAPQIRALEDVLTRAYKTEPREWR